MQREIWDINTDEISNHEADVIDTFLWVTVSWYHMLKEGMLFTSFLFTKKKKQRSNIQSILKGSSGLDWKSSE